MNGRNHWIKLYVEMLDDPKVGLLPDAVKWRWVSVLMQAGELNEDGFLPDVNDMAWRFHTNVETLQGEMRMLAGRGLVELRTYDDGSERWFIPAFERRQRAATSTERSQMRRHRARQNNAGNEDATDVQRNVAKKLHKQKQKQNTETETEGEGSGANAPAHAPVASPVPGETFQPVPETIKRQKRRAGIEDSEPDVIAAAPAALRVLARLSGYWPGTDVADALVDRLGAAPDEAALARAVELWRLSGNKPTNWLGIIDWYDELRRAPDWTPQTRFKPRQNGAAALSPAEQAADRYVKAKRAVLGDLP